MERIDTLWEFLQFTIESYAVLYPAFSSRAARSREEIMKKSIVALAVLGLSLALAFGCGGGPATDSTPDSAASEEPAGADEPDKADKPSKPINRVVVPIHGKSGSELAGTMKIGRIKGAIAMGITLDDAPPGEHAVLLHETGDCSAEDASSAGGHWSLGGIGNIVVGEDYKGELKFTAEQWELGTGGPNDIIGKAVVIHEKPDDFTNQPTGQAGARIGCGAIR